ncbi:MAG TPA: MarR family transcriptional regulator [Trebonia sp.]|nr:MarR family transcriptional regulator [Trebonia sp.]
MTESGPVLYGEIEELAGALRVSVGMLVRRFKQAEPDDDLTMPETSALSRLDRGGPMTSSELARQDRVSPQSMGVTVAALEQRGLIARSRDPEDGRRIMLSLTEAGRQVVHTRRGARTELIARALRDSFTEDERAQLRTVLPLVERLAEKL